MSIDWTATVLGTLCFLFLGFLMKRSGGVKGGGFYGASGGSAKVTASWVAKSILAFMGGVFLAFSIFGAVILAGLGYLPVVVIGGAVIVALFVAGWDISKDRNANKGAVAALILIPLLLVAAAGPIAQTGERAVTSIFEGTTSNVGPWLGG